jgi:general secretion pathway protein G
MRLGERKSAVQSGQLRVGGIGLDSVLQPAASPATGNCYLHTRRSGRQQSIGFTLLELLIAMTIILILATMVTPTYHVAVVRSREAVLRDDLYTMRSLIDEYTLDKQQPPSSLQDLVDDGYLRGGLPVDPFTNSNQTWKVDLEDVPLSPGQSVSGIVDVHSGSDEVSSDGETAYSSW